MIVVSDTSALSALMQINQFQLLPGLYQRVIIPESVRDELLAFHPKIPPGVEIISVTDIAAVALLRENLHTGEAEAIVLSRQINADYLLIDEVKGRQAA